MGRAIFALVVLAGGITGFLGGTYLLPTREQSFKQSDARELIIQQSPDLGNILSGPGKFSLHKNNVKAFSGEDHLEIRDISAQKPGWVLWIFKNITPARNYHFRMRVQKGRVGVPPSQLQIKYVAGKKVVSKYFYSFHQGSGRVTPREQARKEMMSVTDEGEGWLFDFVGKAPVQKSSLHVVLMPAIGAKAIGALEVKSISIEKTQ